MIDVYPLGEYAHIDLNDQNKASELAIVLRKYGFKMAFRERLGTSFLFLDRSQLFGLFSTLYEFRNYFNIQLEDLNIDPDILGPLQAKDLILDTLWSMNENIEAVFPQIRKVLNNDQGIEKVNYILNHPEEFVKFALYPHQEEALIEAAMRSNFGLFFEMRLGKTITAYLIALIWNILHGNDKFLVVSPISALESWSREVNNLTKPEKFRVINFSLTKKQDELLDTLLNESDDNPDGTITFLIIHYEIWRAKIFRKLNELLKKWMFSPNGLCLILDEAHKLKNVASKVHKTFAAIGNYSRRILALTGTPAGNGLEDVFGLAKSMRVNHALHAYTLKTFREKYMTQINNMWWVPKSGSEEYVLGILSDYAISASQKEVFKKQILQKEIRHYELTKHQRSLYNEVLQGIIRDLENNIITVENALVESLKLLQICSGFVIHEGEKLMEFPTEKDELLLDLLNTYDKEQFIIWTIFNEESEKLSRLLQENHVSFEVIDGSTPAQKRVEILNNFRAGGFRVLISKATILGAGVDLSNARISVFYSRDYSYINRDQALSRQLHPAASGVYVVYDLVGSGTIEEKILDAVERKQQINSMLKDLASFKKFVES